MKILDENGVKTLVTNVKNNLKTKADLQEGNVPVEQLGNIQKISSSTVDEIWGGDPSTPSYQKKKKRERRIIFRKSISMYTADDARYEYAYVSARPCFKVPTNQKFRIFINGQIFEGLHIFNFGHPARLTEENDYFIATYEGKGNFIPKYIILASLANTIENERGIFTVLRYEYDMGVLNIYIKRRRYNKERSYTGRFFVEDRLYCTDIIPIDNFIDGHNVVRPFFQEEQAMGIYLYRFAKWENIVMGLRCMVLNRRGHTGESCQTPVHRYRFARLYKESDHKSTKYKTVARFKYTKGLPHTYLVKRRKDKNNDLHISYIQEI